MLTLRLVRHGKRNAPSFRIVVQEKHRAPSSIVLEVLGFYNPRSEPATFVVKRDRADYWLQRGAQLSDTLFNLFIEHGIVKGEKRAFVKPKKQEAAEGKAAQQPTAGQKAPAEEAKK